MTGDIDGADFTQLYCIVQYSVLLSCTLMYKVGLIIIKKMAVAKGHKWGPKAPKPSAGARRKGP